jgi:hypothetical protein
MWLRLRIAQVARIFMNALTNPQIRRAQARDTLLKIALTANENISPPIPDPAEQIPFAILRRFWNHCGSTAILGIQVKPMPNPTRTPWERYSCQMRRAKEAEMKPEVWQRIPRAMGRWTP